MTAPAEHQPEKRIDETGQKKLDVIFSRDFSLYKSIAEKLTQAKLGTFKIKRADDEVIQRVYTYTDHSKQTEIVPLIKIVRTGQRDWELFWRIAIPAQLQRDHLIEEHTPTKKIDEIVLVQVNKTIEIEKQNRASK